SPGTFAAEHVSLRGLLMEAYGVRSFQIQGAPAWVASDRFQIVATYASEPIATAGPTRPTTDWKAIDSMLQQLLEERFHLKSHREIKQLPLYRLAVTAASHKLARANCKSIGQTPDASLKDTPNCSSRYGMRGLDRTLDWTGATLDDFARFALPNILDRPVVNETNLVGTFDIHLAWTPD